MKLFLSSYDIGNAPEALAELVGKNKRVALIRNAADPFGPRRPHYFVKFKAQFASIGLTIEELDLRDFVAAKVDLKKHLAGYGLIWASGGNTFALRWAMNKSGFDRLLPELLQSSDIVYGGFSAGACVLGPSLRGIHLADEPEKVPAHELQWEGLGLVDFCLAPHFRSDHPESPVMEKVVAYYQEHKMKFHALHDGEALQVLNGDVKKVGFPEKA